MNPESNQKRIAFGYDRFNGRIVINEGQAAVVKLIYTWYAEGMSLGEIKKDIGGYVCPLSPEQTHLGQTGAFQYPFKRTLSWVRYLSRTC